MPGNAWSKIGLRKRAERAAKIPRAWTLPPSAIPSSTNGRHSVLDVPRTCGILTKEELEITEQYDATALGEAIASRKLRAIDVTRAFCKRAAIAQQVTNCLTEIFFDRALTRAEALDAHLDAGKPPLSPLHGVPISLKDTFQVPGYDTSIGIAALCFEASSTPSALVQVLLDAGAVLYCKTNVPQTLGALDSHNNVFGRTLNPHNAAVTAGGSSGGEGALIAMRGSVLGVGTDIGGSIRIPAMCNGLYGIKPSWQRVPYAGQQNGTTPALTKVGLEPSVGPLAGSLRDCTLFLETVAAQSPWLLDPDVVPGLWSSLSTLPEKSKLKIGLVTTDGLITPLPPIQALLTRVASTLSSSPHTTVQTIDMRKVFSRCQSLSYALLGIDGAEHMASLLAQTKEPLSPWLAKRFKSRPPMTLAQVQALHARREELEKAWLSAWKESGVDVLLCPVAPHPVPKCDGWNGVSYTITFNLLDYPAGVIPVGELAHQDVEAEIKGVEEALGSWDKANRAMWTDVDRSVYVGTPLCVQIVAPKLQERKLTEAMEIIDSVLRAARGREAGKGARF